MIFTKLYNKWRAWLKTPEPTPSQSHLNFLHNIEVLKKHFYLDSAQINEQNNPILTSAKIGDKIGKGGYGVVFNLDESGFTVKFFEDAHSFQADIERYKRTEDEVWSGKATSGVMHYYESGKINDINLFYVVMPRIIPFNHTDFFRKENVFFQELSFYLKHPLKNKVKPQSYESLDKFLMAARKMLDNEFSTSPQEIQEKYRTYTNTVNKILRAVYAVKKTEGGTDFHLANLGFYQQQPENLFFFDM